MKVTAKGRCALRAMVELALHEDKRLPVKEIARRQNLSVRYLEQVFSALKKEKLINGTKGPTGGYTLERSPTKITMADIIFAVEGRAQIFQEGSQKDVLQTTIDHIWLELDDTIESYLKGITLAQITLDFKNKSANQYMYYI